MTMTRRDAIKLIVAASSAPAAGAALRSSSAGRQSLRWNSDWRFFLNADEASDSAFSAADFDDSGWELVQLPHWGRLEAYDVSRHFQGLCWYRKVLHPDEAMRGHKVAFACEGAMQVADVWVNGTHRLQHLGGYLPFQVDLTQDVERGGPVVIAIRLDNRDNSSVPPGKPLAKMDFCYFSGMYRNVSLEITGPLHISDPVEANRVAGGGIFFRCTQAVPGQAAEVEVATHVVNGQNEDADSVQAILTLSTADGRVVAQGVSGAVRIGARGTASIRQKLTVENPELWSPESPRLYHLRVRIASHSQVVDEIVTRVGLRRLLTDSKRGFFLNGEHRVPSGANRHQAYPYIGNALSDEAQYRDAKRLKDAGFELIRLSHYPQSPAFLDACDELGLMVIACIPGWQHFEDSAEFKGLVVQNLRDLIRRDRNHPCVVLWETSLNETYGHDLFFRELVETAKEEYPGDQMLTCGDAEGHNFDVIRYDVPYSGWDDATHTRPNRAHGAMSLHREYGDNQFGAYSRYSRGDGEFLMLVQAWNYQTALNQQLQLPYTWGQCIWEGIDNNRGMDPKIAACGALDLFRLPKFMAHFYRSQTRIDSRAADGSAMLFIANHWTNRSPRNVVVFSNADEVELFINGRSFRRQRPDHGEDVPFGDMTGFDQTYWLKSAAQPHYEGRRQITAPIYNGGNCKALLHPPFTFLDLPFEPGELKAIGYRNGAAVAQAARRTPAEPHRVEIGAALEGRAFGAGGDVIIVHASIVDEHGTVVPGASMPVRFHAEGPALLIGDNPRAAEAGIASILLRSQKMAGAVELTAEAEGLPACRLRVAIRKTPAHPFA